SDADACFSVNRKLRWKRACIATRHRRAILASPSFCWLRSVAFTLSLFDLQIQVVKHGGILIESRPQIFVEG
ncbi:MAG: hypothetical protein KGJ19_07245, partial [Betaproteobacteria bacterium]|nr:hypothetical protein [Betaproteobacteria bacterium]